MVSVWSSVGVAAGELAQWLRTFAVVERPEFDSQGLHGSSASSPGTKQACGAQLYMQAKPSYAYIIIMMMIIIILIAELVSYAFLKRKCRSGLDAQCELMYVSHWACLLELLVHGRTVLELW